MSWSVHFIGKADHVTEALLLESTKLQGTSKAEYDAALPSIIALVQQNWNTENPPVINVRANGHGYDTYRICNCDISLLNAVLV